MSGSISFTYHLIPRGRKTIWILHIAFADDRIQTRAACAASECAIHYSIASRQRHQHRIPSEWHRIERKLEKNIGWNETRTCPTDTWVLNLFVVWMLFTAFKRSSRLFCWTWQMAQTRNQILMRKLKRLKSNLFIKLNFLYHGGNWEHIHWCEWVAANNKWMFMLVIFGKCWRILSIIPVQVIFPSASKT